MKRLSIKKIILSLACSAAIFSAMFVPAQAALISSDKAQEFNKNLNQLATSTEYDTSINLEKMISSIIRLVLSVLGVIFLVLIFFAGSNWMQAAGNEEKVKKAKETIRDLLIGLCLIIVAYALSSGMGGLLAKVLVSTPKNAETNPSGFDYTPPS